jgi:hypothetical protein
MSAYYHRQTSNRFLIALVKSINLRIIARRRDLHHFMPITVINPFAFKLAFAIYEKRFLRFIANFISWPRTVRRVPVGVHVFYQVQSPHSPFERGHLAAPGRGGVLRRSGIGAFATLVFLGMLFRRDTAPLLRQELALGNGRVFFL